MDLNFTNKVAIVTGGESGIGKGIAELLLSLNAKVYITGLNNTPIWCKNNKNCVFRILDFLRQESVDAFKSEISRLERVDILINNAGIQIMHSVDVIQLDDWNKVMDVNLKGPMQIIKAVAPKMKPFNEGRILNISSVAGLISKPGQSSYSASKSGLIGLTRSCALDLAPYNILVNALCPGTTQTEMVDSVLTSEKRDDILVNVPMNRFGTVREMANFAVFLCSGMNTYMTGQTVVVDGGFTSR